jgi:hypothetical protein
MKHNFKILNSLTILMCLTLLGFNSRSQDFYTDLRVKIEGYIICMGDGVVFFQPCENSKLSIWEALDRRSFRLMHDNMNDKYLNAVVSLGDSALVDVYDSSESRSYPMNISYFYGTVDVVMFLLDLKQVEVFEKPLYEFSYKNMKYNLCGFYVRNRVKKIIPKEKKKVTGMYNYYKRKGYTVPEWLSKLALPNKKATSQ